MEEKERARERRRRPPRYLSHAHADNDSEDGREEPGPDHHSGPAGGESVAEGDGDGGEARHGGEAEGEVHEAVEAAEQLRLVPAGPARGLALDVIVMGVPIQKLGHVIRLLRAGTGTHAGATSHHASTAYMYHTTTHTPKHTTAQRSAPPQHNTA